MFKIKRVTVAFLAICLLSVSFNVSSVQAKDRRYFPEVEHDNIPYEEMSDEPVDMEKFDSLSTELQELIENESTDAEKIAEMLEELENIFNAVYYASRLAYIDMSCDVSSIEAGLKYAQYIADSEQIGNELIKLGKAAFESAVGERVEELLDSEFTKFIDSKFLLRKS